KELGERHDWVQQAEEAKPLIVILDELERVLPRATEAGAARKFVLAFGALRNLGQGTRRLVSLIAADLRPEANRINLLPNAETNPIFGLLHETAIPAFNRGDIHEMVDFIARKMGLEGVKQDFVDELL